MSTEKKITFTGEGSGLLSFMDKVDSKNQSLYRSTLKAALKLSDSSKEQLSFIDLQVKALERKNKELEKEIQLVNELHKEKMKETNELLITGKITSREASDERKALIQERGDKVKGIEDKEGENSKTIDLLRELIDTIKLESRLEIAEDRKNVERSIIETERRAKRGAFVNFFRHTLSEEEMLLRSQQKEILNKEGSTKKSGVFGDVLGANIVTEVLKGLYHGVTRNITGVAGAQNEDFLTPKVLGLMARAVPTVIGAGIGWVPGVGPGLAVASTAIGQIMDPFVTALKERELQEKRERDISSSRLRGAVSEDTVGSLSMFGIKQTEADDLALQVARSRGKGGDDLYAQTTKAIVAEKAFTLDRGLIMQMYKDTRAGTSTMDVMQNTIAAISAMGLSKDYSLLPEYLQLHSSLIQQQASKVSFVDRGQAWSNIRAFSEAGGAWSDPARAGGRIGKVQQALTSPSNEFAQAYNFMLLQEMFPDASYTELREKEEKGMFEGGFFNKWMEMQSRMTGDDRESQIIALQGKTGLGWQDSRLLVDAWRKDNSSFDDVRSEEDLNKLISKENNKKNPLLGALGVGDVANFLNMDKAIEQTFKRAGHLTPKHMKSMAQISDAFADSMVKGFKKAMELNLLKLDKEISDTVEEFFGVKTTLDKIRKLVP